MKCKNAKNNNFHLVIDYAFDKQKDVNHTIMLDKQIEDLLKTSWDDQRNNH